MVHYMVLGGVLDLIQVVEMIRWWLVAVKIANESLQYACQSIETLE